MKMFVASSRSRWPENWDDMLPLSLSSSSQDSMSQRDSRNKHVIWDTWPRNRDEIIVSSFSNGSSNPSKNAFLLVFSSLSKRLDKIAAKPGNGTLPLDSDDLLLTASTVTLHNSFFKTCHRVLLELSVFRLFRSFLFPSRARNWSVGFWFSCGYISLLCWCNLLKKRWISTYNQWYWSKIADGQRHAKQKKLTFTNDD